MAGVRGRERKIDRECRRSRAKALLEHLTHCIAVNWMVRALHHCHHFGYRRSVHCSFSPVSIVEHGVHVQLVLLAIGTTCRSTRDKSR